MKKVPRLAVLRDFPEENWVSMQFCADMLLEQCRGQFADRVEAVPVCASFRRRATALPIFGATRRALNIDRLLNRYSLYPRFLRGKGTAYDLFHIVDHSYAHLALELPAERTGVYCHDIDPFRCLVAPKENPRSRSFRKLMQRILDGFQRASLVFYSTAAVRAEIEQYQLVDSAKLVQATLGTAAEYCRVPAESAPAGPLGSEQRGPFMLHVGSCVPRKRIDVLLRVFAELRRTHPELRLVKVSGQFAAEHEAIIEQHGLRPHMTHLMDLSRESVAHLYRTAALAVLTSDREGFGLPAIEALACGAPLLLSDIPPLREVAGEAARYCPVADIAAWVKAASKMLNDPGSAPAMALRLKQAEKFSWRAHAEAIVGAYEKLMR